MSDVIRRRRCEATKETSVRFDHLLFRVVALTHLTCVAMLAFTATFGAAVAEDSTNRHPWVAMARILMNGEPSGSGGVYLRDGLIITAAHITAADAQMGVRIAGVSLPAKVLKQGSLEDVDLSLLLIESDKVAIPLPQATLCNAPPWPGDEVIILDAERATRSRILAPQRVPFGLQQFATLIADVATTGNSGSGVFDPTRKCLLGIMSRKLIVNGKDIAKFFVPASEIRKFVAAAFQPAK